MGTELKLEPEAKAVLDNFNNKLKAEADSRTFSEKIEFERSEKRRKERNKNKAARKKLRG